MEELDVLKKSRSPTSWINSLVVVEKGNGDTRICLDMRQINRPVLREKHLVPTVEEILSQREARLVNLTLTWSSTILNFILIHEI